MPCASWSYPGYPNVNHGASLCYRGASPFWNAVSWWKSPEPPQFQFSPTTSNHEPKMDHEAETKTIRLTSEIVRCIAKALLASAEELERSLTGTRSEPEGALVITKRVRGRRIEPLTSN